MSRVGIMSAKTKKKNKVTNSGVASDISDAADVAIIVNEVVELGATIGVGKSTDVDILETVGEVVGEVLDVVGEFIGGIFD